MNKNNIFKFVFIFIIILIFSYLTIFGLTIKGKEIISGVKNIKTGLDISGGVSINYQAVNEQGDITVNDLKKSEAVIRKRLEKINIYDFFIRIDDATNQIYLEIPAKIDDKSRDPLEAVKGLDKTAKIEFKDPDGKVLLAGSDIKGAKFSEDPTDSTGLPSPHVVLEFSDEGSKKFAEATGRLIGKELSIALDGEVITSPVVNSKIESTTAIITMGKGTYSEKKTQANEYAMLIDSGALPFTLNIINKEYIGPYIGQKALEISIYAGIASFIFIALFMISIYRLPGLISSIALIAYISIVLCILVVTGTSITLPGIAGLILSIGMAVDANVIIFERLKDELRQNIGFKKAFEKSLKNAMSAIIDGNFTTFVIAILLYIFGIGPVKGFGLILAIGVLVSLFTAIFVTKLMLKQLVPLASNNKFLFGLKKEVK